MQISPFQQFIKDNTHESTLEETYGPFQSGNFSYVLALSSLAWYKVKIFAEESLNEKQIPNFFHLISDQKQG